MSGRGGLGGLCDRTERTGNEGASLPQGQVWAAPTPRGCKCLRPKASKLPHLSDKEVVFAVPYWRPQTRRRLTSHVRGWWVVTCAGFSVDGDPLGCRVTG